MTVDSMQGRENACIILYIWILLILIFTDVFRDMVIATIAKVALGF